MNQLRSSFHYAKSPGHSEYPVPDPSYRRMWRTGVGTAPAILDQDSSGTMLNGDPAPHPSTHANWRTRLWKGNGLFHDSRCTQESHLTIYELNDPNIIAALSTAQGRGVPVLVIDNNNSFASMNMTNYKNSTDHGGLFFQD